MHGEGSIVIATTGEPICDACAVTVAGTPRAGRSLTTQVISKARRTTAEGLHEDPSGTQALMVLGVGPCRRLRPLVPGVAAKVPVDEDGATKEKKCVLGTTSNCPRKVGLRDAAHDPNDLEGPLHHRRGPLP